MRQLAPGEVYPFELDAGAAGIAADLRFRIEDDEDQIVAADTAVGIVEFAARQYRIRQAAPASSGFFTAIWTRQSSGATATEQFEVTARAPQPGVAGRPTVAEVAAELRARTKGGGELGASEMGTFDASTRPTADQAEETITNAYEDLLACFASGTIPDRLLGAFKAACRLRAALKIELSYFPEQTGSETSPYLQLRRDADAAEKRLLGSAAVDLDETNPLTPTEDILG